MADKKNTGKAQEDLRAARESVDKVEFVRRELAELLGVDISDETEIPHKAASEESEPGAEVVEAALSEHVSSLPGQTDYVQAAPYQAPQSDATQYANAPEAQAFPAAQGLPYATPGAEGQGNYWRGFQPVASPAQPVYGQPFQQVVYPQGQTHVQPQQAHALQQQYQVQQAYPAQQPQPQPQMGPQTYGAQAQRHVQPQPVYGQTQPQGQATYGQTQPQGQATYGQAQPQGQAVYGQAQSQAAQAYTPQIQQPSPYVAAQDFTVQPQPTTPAYTKSNKPTLAIVLVVIFGVICIIAAMVIGRILATQASDYQSPFFDEMSNLEEELNEELGLEPEGGNNPGKPEGGLEGHGNDEDIWSFGFDKDDDLDSWGGNASHIEGGGIEADDGELHDAWNKSVSYSYNNREESTSGTERIKAYDMLVQYIFDVDYPQFKGESAHIEKLNTVLESTAMDTVERYYTHPTKESEEVIKRFAAIGIDSTEHDGSDAVLCSNVDYAIMYNNEDFVSVAFSDECLIGSWLGSFIDLRTVNANLKTGELYEIDDVLMLNEDIANAFIDNHSKYDEGAALSIIGREAFVQAILGKGEFANSVKTTFFVDGNGKVNLGVTYELTKDGNIACGWWDYTLTDAQLETAKRDSSFWELLS